MKRLAILVFVAFTVFGLTESVANAATGYVKGTWKFQQYGGGYCPDSTDPTFCQGARYVEADYATAQPIRSGKVYLQDSYGNVVGVCPTDENGDYFCTWNSGQTTPSLRVRFKFENYEDRFKIVGPNGAEYAWQSTYFTAHSGMVKTIGTITIPKMGITQLFDAGTRMYNDSLSTSSTFWWLFGGLEVRAFHGDPDLCSACFDFNLVRIYIRSASKAYETFNIMHEFGHAADYFARPRDIVMYHDSVYCYPSTTGSDCGHAPDSSEWRGVARAEGLATFFALTAWFDSDAPKARSCFGDGDGVPCIPPSVEYAEDVTNCASDKGRKEYTSTRYYWDLFDPVNEPGDNMTVTLDQIASSIYYTPFGYDWGERESFYASDGQTVDAWDSFHAWEWNQQFESYTGLNSSPVYFHNCLGYF